MLKVRLATTADVEFLAPRLRQADVDEMKAHSGTDPYDALMVGLQVSEPAMVGANEKDEPVLMFGVATLDDLVGSAWMLSSDEIIQHRLSFLKQSRREIDTLNRRWKVLTNVCDERNVLHIEWMKWLGYVFINRHPNFGVEGRPFLEFVRVNHDV